MAVDAVIGSVQDAIFEPFDGDIAGEIGVFDFGGGFKPVEAPGHLGPELIGVFEGLFVHCLIFLFGNEGVFERFF